MRKGHPHKCPECNGSGLVRTKHYPTGSFNTEATINCFTCKGTGKIKQNYVKEAEMTNREEIIAIKRALRKAGIPFVSVKHGRGTTWDWLEINEGPQQRPIEECTESRGRIIKLAQEVTGRSGDYDGKIIVVAQ